MTITVYQSPDHVVLLRETVLIDNDPYVVTDIKAKREEGTFLDWERRIESRVVVITVERFDGNPA